MTHVNKRSPRIGMQSTQQRHIIATKEMDRPIIATGVEKAIPYQLSDAFVIKAKKDGFVSSLDEETGLMIVDYKNGKQDIYDISRQTLKNSNGGFYTSKTLTPIVKEGEKFKAGDILAKDSTFFSGNKQGDISYDLGRLSHVALAESDGTLRIFIGWCSRDTTN